MTSERQRDERLDRLKAFLGEWRLEAPAFTVPADLAEAAHTTFKWTLDGAFLLQRRSSRCPKRQTCSV